MEVMLRITAHKGHIALRASDSLANKDIGSLKLLREILYLN